MGLSVISLFLLILHFSSGQIVPDPQVAIQPLCTNAQCVGEYFFTMTIGTAISNAASITIEFPQEYTTQNLGIVGTPQGYVTFGGVETPVTCTISGQVITWPLASGSLVPGKYIIAINQVNNPQNAGKTSNFKARTYSGSYPIDVNLAYGSIVISPLPTPFTASSISSTTVQVINLFQTYQFSVTLANLLPKDSWLRVTFPSYYYLDGPLTCAVDIFPSNSFICTAFELGSREIIFSPFPSSIAAGKTMTVSISGVQNPSFTGLSGYFYLEALQSSVYTVLQSSNLLGPVSINPGAISVISVTGNPLQMGQLAWYNFTAKVTNPVPANGRIRIGLPLGFQGLNGCLVTGGLIGTNSLGRVTCVLTQDVNVAYFTDFLSIASGTVFTILIRGVNPASVQTSVFSIQTQLNNTNAIDYVSGAWNYTYTSPPVLPTLNANVDLLKVRVDRKLGETGPLELYLNCKTLLLRTYSDNTISTVGRIEIKLPTTVLPSSNLDNVTAKLSCLFGRSADRAVKCAWNSTTWTIIIETPVDLGLEECPLPIKITVIGNALAQYHGFQFPVTTLGQQVLTVRTQIKNGLNAPLDDYEAAEVFFLVPPKNFTSGIGVTAAGAFSVSLLHSTVSELNQVQVNITTSVTIPPGSDFEFEFTGFAPGLGYPNNGQFPFVYSNTWGSFQDTLVEIGTSSTIVTLISSSSTILAGTKGAFWLPQVLNGATVGVVPTLTVRTRIVTSEAIESQSTSFNAWTASTYQYFVSATVSPTSSQVQSVSTQLDFSLVVNWPLSANDHMYLVFGSDFAWTDSPNNVQANGCPAGVNQGNLATDYIQVAMSPARSIVYTPSSITTTLIAPCLVLPRQLFYRSSSTITVFAIRSGQVVEKALISLNAVSGNMVGVAVSEAWGNPSQSLINQPALYQVTFTIVDSVNVGGSINILFPGSFYAPSLPANCYRLIGFQSTTECISSTSVSYNSVTYQRYLLTGWSNTLNPGSYTAYVLATPTTAGAASIQIVSSADLLLDQVIDTGTFSLTLSNVGPPTKTTLDAFVSPRIEMRAGEFGVLTFSITPQYVVQATTSSTSYGYVQVTIPTVGVSKPFDPANPVTDTFTQAAGSYLDCRFSGTLASQCIVNGSTIKVYTPSALSLAVGTTYTLAITALDATTSTQIGFQAPSNVGYYQFVIGTYVVSSPIGSSDVLNEQSIPWVYVGPTRFTQVSVKSYSKSAGQYTALHFSFNIATAVPASSAGGVIFIGFPYDTTGKGWTFDLGTGLANNSPIDCPSSLGTTQGFTCQLIHGFTDQVKVKLTGFTALVSGTTIEFTLAGLKNPTANMYDLGLTIASFTYTTTDNTDPYYAPLDLSLATYIDTTLLTAQTQVTSNSADNYFALTHYYTPTDVFLHIDNSAGNFGAGDRILVQLPTDYSAAGVLNTCVYSIATPRCLSFPITGWVLISFTVQPPAAVNSLAFGPITTAGYQYAVQFVAYLFIDRKTAVQVTINFPVANLLPLPDLLTSNNFDVLSGVEGLVETYCFQIQTATRIPMAGQLQITFPQVYASLLIPAACYLGPNTSNANQLLHVACVQLGYPTLPTSTLSIYNFAQPIPGGNIIEICVDSTHPPEGTYQPFLFETYYTKDTSRPIDSAWPDLAGITTQYAVGPPMSFSAGAQYVDSTQDLVVTSGGVNTAPLFLTITLASNLQANKGYVQITGTPTIALPSGGELRCIWTTGTTQYISHTCSVSNSVFTIPAPIGIDLVANTVYTLQLTSINGDVDDGLYWATSGRYALDVLTSVTDGSATGGQTRVFVNVSPDVLRQVSVVCDHLNAGYRNRYIFTIKTGSVSIPSFSAGGRLAFEFPLDLYDALLGYSANHATASCLTFGLTAASPVAISCYLDAGNPTLNKNPRIILTGFSAIPTGTTVTVHLDDLTNPSVFNNNFVVWLKVLALDVSGGWPGTIIAQRRIDNLFTLQKPQNPAEVITSNAPMAVSVGYNYNDNLAMYTFEIVKPKRNFIKTGDVVYLVFDSRLKFSYATLEIRSGASQVIYYPTSHTVILTMLATPGNAEVALDDFVNTIIGPATGYTYTGLHIQSKTVISTFSSLPTRVQLFWPRLTGKGQVERVDGLTEFFGNDAADWRFTYTPGFSYIPAGGTLYITLTTSSFNEGTCYNDIDKGSALIGTYTCTISADFHTASITFASQQTNSALIFIANVLTSSVSDQVYFKTALGTALIEAPQAPVVITLNGKTAPSYHEVPVQTQFHNYIRAGNTGSVQIGIGNVVLNQGVGTVQIDLPAGGSPAQFSVAPGGTLRCVFGTGKTALVAGACTQTTVSSLMTVVATAPWSVAIPVTSTTLTITTVNAVNPLAQGLVYPVTAGFYSLVVRAYSDGVTLAKTGTETLVVLSTTQFQQLVITPGHTANGLVNYFQFTINPQTSIPSGGTIRFQFPLVDKWGNPIFAQDLGLGEADNSAVGCYIATVATQPTCTLHWGLMQYTHPSYITVSGIGAVVPAGTAINVYLDEIVNPATLGVQNVDITVFSLDGNNVILDSQTIFDAFTTTANPAYSCTQSTAPVFTGTAYSATATLAISLPTPTAGVTQVVQLPFSLNIAGGDSLAGSAVYHAVSQWIFVSGATSVTITFGAGGLKYVPVGTTLQVYNFLNGALTCNSLTNPIGGGSLLAGNALTAVPQYASLGSATSMYINQYGDFMLSYTLLKSVSVNGCIQFIVSGPTSFESSVCVPSYTSATGVLNAASCSYGSGKYTIKAFSQGLSAGNAVNLIGRVKLSTGLTANVNTFNDNLCTQFIEQDSGTTNPVLKPEATLAAPTTIFMKTLTPVKQVTLPGGLTDLEFFFKPNFNSFSYSGNTIIDLIPSFPFSIPQGTIACELSDITSNSRVSSSCQLSNDGSIRTYPLGSLNSGDTYRIYVTTNGAPSGANGLKVANTAQQANIQLKILQGFKQANLGIFYFSIPDHVFTYLRVTPAHVTANVYNVFHIEADLGLTLSTSQRLVVEFPTTTIDRSQTLFAEIPTPATNGKSLLCAHISGFTTAGIACRIFSGSAAYSIPVQVTVEGTGNANQIDFYLAGIYNPSNANDDSSIVHIRVFVEDKYTGRVIAERTAENVFAPEGNTPDNSVPNMSTNNDGILNNAGTPSTGTASKLIVLNDSPNFTLVNVGSVIVNFNGAAFYANSVATYSSIQTNTVCSNMYQRTVTAILIGTLTSRTSHNLWALGVKDSTISFINSTPCGGVRQLLDTIETHLSFDLSDWTPAPGAWSTATLAFAAKIDLTPGLYFHISLNFPEFDPNSFLPTVFPAEVASTLRWKATESGFTMWGYESSIPANTPLAVQVFADCSESGFSLRICEDDLCTKEVAQATSSSNKNQGLTFPVLRVSANPQFQVLAPVNILTVQATTDIEMRSGELVKVDLTYSTLHCAAGSHQLMCRFDARESQCAYENGVITIYTTDTIPAGHIIVLEISLQTLCVPSSAGFAMINVSLKDRHQATLVSIAPAASFSQIETYLAASSLSTQTFVDLSFQTDQILMVNDVLRFTFKPSEDGKLYARDLGLGVSEGDFVPFYASTASVHRCRIQNTMATSRSSESAPTIYCRVMKEMAADSKFDISFPMVYTPSAGSLFLVSTSALRWTDGKFTEVLSGQHTHLLEPASCASASSITPHLSTNTTTMSTEAEFYQDLGNFAHNFLIQFPADYDVSQVTAGRNLAMAYGINGPAPCPCVLGYIDSPASDFSIVGLHGSTAPLADLTVLTLQQDCTSAVQRKVERRLQPNPPIYLTVGTPHICPEVPMMYDGQDLWTINFTMPANAAQGWSIRLDLWPWFYTQIALLRTTVNIMNAPTYTMNYVQYNRNSMTISNLPAVSAGALISIDKLFVPLGYSNYAVNVPVTLIAPDGSTIASQTFIQRLDESVYYLARNFYANRPALYGGNRDPVGPLSYTLHFVPAAAMTQANTNPDTINDRIDFWFQESAFALASANEMYYAYFVVTSSNMKLVASKVVKSFAVLPKTLTVYMPPMTGLSAGTDYDLVIGASNYQTDGLTFPATGLPSLRVTLTSGTTLYSAQSIPIPGGSPFLSLNVRPFDSNPSLSNYYLIQFSPNTAGTKANDLEVVIQFPVFDQFNGQMFSNSVIAGTVSGQDFSCAVYNGATLNQNAVCTYYSGNSANIVGYSLAPQMVVVSGVENMNNGDKLSIALWGVTSPTVAGNLVVYTRQVSTSTTYADRFTILDYSTALFPVPSLSYTPTSETRPWPTISSYVIGSTATYTFSLFTNGFDVALLTLPSIFGASLTGVTLTAPPGLFIAVTNNQGLIVPTTPVGRGTLTLTLASIPSQEYVTLATGNVFKIDTTNISTQRHSEVFTAQVPTSLWTPAAVSNLIPNFGTGHFSTPSGNVYHGISDNFQIKMSFPTVTVPQQGSIILAFPSDFVSVSALATLSFTENIVLCSGAGVTWTCVLPVACPAGTSVTIAGRAKTPASGTTSGKLSVTVNYNNLITSVIAQNNAFGSFTYSDGVFSVPEDLYVPIQRRFIDVPVLAGEKGMITVLFQPKTSLAAGSIITLTAGKTGATNNFPDFVAQTNERPICKFEAQQTNYQTYTAAACSYASAVWTIQVPTNQVISASVQWKLTIYSTGGESFTTTNGIPFPINSVLSYTIDVTLPDGTEFKEVRYNLMTHPAALQIQPVKQEATMSDNIIEVTFKSTGDAGATGRFSLLFPVNIGSNAAFAKDVSNGGSLACNSDIGTSSAYACAVAPQTFAYMNGRVLRLDLQGYNALSGTSNQHAFFAGIYNPAITSLSAWVGFQVFSTTTTTPVLTAYHEMHYLLPTLPTSSGWDTKNSPDFMATLSDKNIGTTGVSTSGFSLGVAIPSGEFFILIFNYDITASTAVTTYELTSFQRKRTILCKSNQDLGIISTDPFVLTGMTNPSYLVTGGMADIYIYDFSGKQVTHLNIIGNSNFTPYSITVSPPVITQSGTAENGVLQEYSLTFTYPQSVPLSASFGFLILIPGSVGPFCTVSTVPTDDGLGQKFCDVTNGIAYITFSPSAYTSNTPITVLIWSTGSTGVGQQIRVVSFIDAPNYTKSNGLGLQTVTVINNNSLITVSPFSQSVKLNPKTLLRAGDVGPLTFSLTPTVPLYKGIGKVSIVLVPGLVTLDPNAGALVCIWKSSAGVRYQASACTWTPGTWADQLDVTASVLATIDTATTWTVFATTTMGSLSLGRQGFTYAVFSSLASGQYLVTATGKSMGYTPTNYFEDTIYLSPQRTAHASILSYGNAASSPIAMSLSFTPSTTIGPGLQNGGSTDIRMRFDQKVFGVTLGSTLVSQEDYTDNFGLTDCASTATFGSSTKCYLRRGIIDTGKNAEIWVRNFQSLNAANSGLLIGPIYHLTPTNKIVNLRIQIRSFNAATFHWDFLQYMEFNYVYMIVTPPATVTTGPTAAFTVSSVQAITSLTFTQTLAATIPSNSNRGMILLNFQDSVPLLTGITVAAPHTVYNMPINRAVIILPGAPLGSPVVLQTFPVPQYVWPQNWTGSMYSSGLLTDSFSYSVPVTGVTLPSVSVALFEGLAGLQSYTGVNTVFTLRVRPSLMAISGGAILIQIPTAVFETTAGACVVDGGLTGPYECTWDNAAKVYTLVGYNTFDGTNTASTAILLKFTVSTVHAILASNLGFTVTTYGIYGNTNTLIESGQATINFPIISMYTLTTTSSTWFQTQASACLGNIAPLIFRIQPANLYVYKSQIKVGLYGLGSYPNTGVVECVFSSSPNNVPSEGGCAYSNGVITATVPEQLPLTTSKLYKLAITFRDTGNLHTDGITLPSPTQIISLLGTTVWQVTVNQPNGSIQEAVKITQGLCGVPFQTITPRLGTLTVNSKTYLDLTLQLSSGLTVPAGGVVVLNFPTNNGLLNVYPLDLGVGATVPTPVSCSSVPGFLLTTEPTCVVYPVATAALTFYVTIGITNHGGLTSANPYRILIGKLQTPLQAREPIFSNNYNSQFRVYTLSSQFLDQAIVSDSTILRYPKPPLYFLPAATQSNTGTLSTLATAAQDSSALTFTFNTASITTLGNSQQGTVVLEFDSNFVLPKTQVPCSGLGLTLGSTCQFWQIVGLNWLIASVATSGSAVPISIGSTLVATMRSQEYTLVTGYTITAYVYNDIGSWTDTYRATPASLKESASSFVVTTSASNNMNTYNVYTFTITPQTHSAAVNRVQILFASSELQFQWLDSSCHLLSGLTGLIGTTCIVSTTPQFALTLTGFSDPNPAAAFSIGVGLMTPGQSGTTGSFTVNLYNSLSGTDRLIETSTGSPQTISHWDYPKNIRMYWPVDVFYDRYLRAGQTGEIRVRFTPTIPLTNLATSQIKVTVPSFFTIATGGTPSCQFYQKDMYEDNQPLWTTVVNHANLAPCTWNSVTNTITMSLGPALGSVTTDCIYLSLTTTGAPGVNGYTAASPPGTFYATVTTYNSIDISGNFVQAEFFTAQFYLHEVDVPSTGFALTSTTSDMSAETLLLFSFRPDVVIPRGYDSFNNMTAQAKSYIRVFFDIFDAFQTDLGEGYKYGDRIPCAAQSGIVPVGGQLNCTFIPGDSTLTTPVNATINITNFEEIPANTLVQFQIARVMNPPDLHDHPTIWLSIETTYFDDVFTGIYYPTQPPVPLQPISCSSACVELHPCSGANWNKAGVCTPCGTGCALCISDSECLECLDIYQTTPSSLDNSCVKDKCSLGSYLDENDNCQQCGINCLLCSSATQCEVCTDSDAFEPDSSTNACASVLTCDLGMYYDGVECVDCDSTCDECFAVSTCHVKSDFSLSCTITSECSVCSDSAFIPNVKSSDCIACPTGTWSNGRTCEICEPYCTTCDSDGVCTDCMIGYAFKNKNSLTCEPKCSLRQYSAVGSSTCLPCDSSCADCGLSSTITGTAYTYQPACLVCVQANATSVPNTVTCQCPSGTFGSSCIACGANCSSCSSATSCTTCNVGSYLDSGVCKPCGILCSQCSSSTKCDACAANTLSPVSGTNACSWPNAFACPIGFAFNAIECVPCAQGCNYCNVQFLNGNFQTVCVTCTNSATLAPGDVPCITPTARRLQMIDDLLPGAAINAFVEGHQNAPRHDLGL